MEASAQRLATPPFLRLVHFSSPRAAYATALFFAVLLLFTLPAQASSFSGNFDGNATLTPTGTPGVFIQNFTGDGTDNIFGAFDVTSMSTIDFTNPPHITFTNGMITETYMSGVLMAKGSGTGTAN